MNWRLRKPDGTIYGPVAFAEFYRWASEGRILPEDFVSENDGAWIPAPDAAALELDWLLPRGEGALGPLHLLAFAELLQQRMLQGNEPIVKKTGGDPIPVGQAVAGELLRRVEVALADLVGARVEMRTLRAVRAKQQEEQGAVLREQLLATERARDELQQRVEALKAEQLAAPEEITRLRAQLNEERSRTQSLETALAKAHEQIAELSARAQREPDHAPAARPEKMHDAGREKEFKELTDRYERLLAQTREEAERSARLQMTLNEERAAAAKQQAEMAGQLRTAQEETVRLRAELAKANERIAELNAREEIETHRVPTTRPEKMNATGREKEFQDLTRRYERLLARTREEAERNDELQKALAEERKAAAQDKAETDERLRSAQEEVARLNARIEEQERHYQELIRDFRELNDRYIRLRNDKDPASASAAKPKVRLV